MRILEGLLTTSVFLILASCNSNSDSISKLKLKSVLEGTFSSAIMGGTVVPENSQISQSIVGIYDDLNESICTGSLIGDNLILTAAHCVYDSDPQKMQIVFGTDIMAVVSTTEVDVKAELMRDVVSFKYHEQYNPEEQETNDFDWSDIAIIKFKGSLPSGYKPADLLQDRKEIKPGLNIALAGYGVSEVSTYPVEARKVKNLKEAIANGDVVCDDGNQNCIQVNMSGDGELRVTNAQIAHVVRGEIRVDESHGHGTCSGDSGGPMYLEKSGQYYLIGVTSRGSLLCNRVGVYTNTAYYLDWIKFNVSQLK